MENTRSYDLTIVPIDIAHLALDLAKSKYEDVGLVSIEVGIETKIKSHLESGYYAYDAFVCKTKEESLNHNWPTYFQKTSTVIEIGLNDLIEVSKETIPFNKIPLCINDVTIPPIMRVVLKERLLLGE